MGRLKTATHSFMPRHFESDTPNLAKLSAYLKTLKRFEGDAK